LVLFSGEVLAGEGLFVAVGYGGRRMTSIDGFTWENDQRWSDEVKDNDDVLFNVAYGAGRFVVVGPGGLIESSHDGQTWVRHDTEEEDFSRVVWTGTRFVASGGKSSWTSPDGLMWKKETWRIPCSLAWAREGFLGLGFSWGVHVHTSRDLREWHKLPVLPGPSLNAVAFGAP
jgi:hypothetical protein